MSLKSRDGCGCLVMIIAMAVLLLPVLFPSFLSTASDPLQSILCEPGETLSVETFTRRNRQGEFIGSSAFYCVNGTEKRNVSESVSTISVALFFVLAFLGFAIGDSSPRRMPRSAEVSTKKKTDQTEMAFPLKGSDSLTSSDRLEDLKRAYDMDLISEAEYHGKRKVILDEL